jgi:hypothetical protein
MHADTQPRSISLESPPGYDTTDRSMEPVKPSNSGDQLAALSTFTMDPEPQRIRADSAQTLRNPDPNSIKESLSPQQPSSLVLAKFSLPSVSGSSPPVAACAEKENTTVFSEAVRKQSQSSRGSARSRVQLSHLHRFCRHWLTAYHLLAAFTFIANAIVLGVLIAVGLPLGGVLNATAANLLVSILVRQEDLINMAFSVLARIPSSLPLLFRSTIADFHHYGGVHIGCAVSALLWYCLFIVVNTRAAVVSVEARTMTSWHWADIATCYVFLMLIALICLLAIPRFREKVHNCFERTHRFGGWASLAVLWINSGIHTKVDTHGSLYSNPSIWLLSMATFFIILPWLRMRRIPIQAHAVSSREIRLTFPCADMPYTSTSRFSLSPLIEWHAFATIPSRDGFTADIIISAAGDWTKSLISNPPEHMWIRQPAARNFLALTPIFNSVLLVATGAGIGPMLSLLSSPAIETMKADGKRIRVMWCVHNPDAPHWDFVQTMIRNVDPMPKIFDSRQCRPDIPFEVRYLVQVHDLEAVMVVSNKKVTNDVIEEVKAHGCAAYGAVFDS